MAEGQVPKFVLGKAYSRDEFVYTAEGLAQELTHMGKLDVAELMQRSIEWAKGHPIGTWFVFEEDEEGVRYPIAHVNEVLSLNPDPFRN
ncbi:hypothetical protein A2368_00085 [Candidatus Collierbacteria bacterium RIFOXYB1_FULL_49_13]|uniref:Uncharacterized protein n=1 Tax=Candidatus Collierbacteria bacterium RIFOXYB1_FULL_49_13 TaxID=1817728 RepID=A0A1F5FIS9_9BACT|nr:MAG: hypothetical protein A2368_00085 [Candidatus Collierbacteria bacterium RIFOXYB1_FULL_49_13]